MRPSWITGEAWPMPGSVAVQAQPAAGGSAGNLRSPPCPAAAAPRHRDHGSAAGPAMAGAAASTALMRANQLCRTTAPPPHTRHPAVSRVHKAAAFYPMNRPHASRHSPEAWGKQGPRATGRDESAEPDRRAAAAQIPRAARADTFPRAGFPLDGPPHHAHPRYRGRRHGGACACLAGRRCQHWLQPRRRHVRRDSPANPSHARARAAVPPAPRVRQHGPPPP